MHSATTSTFRSCLYGAYFADFGSIHGAMRMRILFNVGSVFDGESVMNLRYVLIERTTRPLDEIRKSGFIKASVFIKSL